MTFYQISSETGNLKNFFIFRNQALQMFLLLKDIFAQRSLEETLQNPREEDERQQAEVQVG